MSMQTNGSGNGSRADVQSTRIAEIVAASTTSFRAVATRTFSPPPFGSFVKTTSEERVTFGVVAHVEHSSIDPSRRAMPLGRSWEELAREQPQVLELLTTEFEAICVAHLEPGWGIQPYLPPVPPRVHEFVEHCTAQQIASLTEDLTFVRTLGAVGGDVAGELVAAAIRAGAEVREDRRQFLLRAGREVADLYRQDYEQACAILRRLGMRVAGDGWQRTPPATVALRGESAK